MIGKEVGFGTDNFGKPKILSTKDSVAQIILNILLMRPGNLPSLPHVGINIKEYLYKMEEEIDVLELKNKIYSQCKELLPVMINDDIKFYINNVEGNDVLILFIPVSIEVEAKPNEDQGVLLAFSKSETGELNYTYNYQSLARS